MSLRGGSLRGHRRNEASEGHHRIPHQPQEPMGLGQLTHPLPFAAFPMEPSPMLNTPHIDWKETSEAHVYKAHLPGYNRHDVRVEVDDDRVLCIVCGKSAEKKEHVGPWHRVQLSSGQFVHRLSLPQNAVVDHVKAYMDNGFLTITVPKHHKAHHNRVRNINISSRP
ncbi:18.1 kDa class I heat shock protein [Cajanus cajan]|uniref:18.1 kDa class I heat shock protein n=1 Tax=Cajanus cajan TaxID=3821 RepID=A0A151R1G5_CAJCA|nr:18.1 kDa class I heat shock protein [Cajanus cajan]KYP36441.1 18.1 kDa class I heat shock protein [Cajanus cajan]